MASVLFFTIAVLTVVLLGLWPTRSPPRETGWPEYIPLFVALLCASRHYAQLPLQVDKSK